MNIRGKYKNVVKKYIFIERADGNNICMKLHYSNKIFFVHERRFHAQAIDVVPVNLFL